MAEINVKEVNEKSLELMANIAEPYFELLQDKEFITLYLTNVLEAIKYACLKHPEQTVKIAAALEGKTVEEYVVNPFTLPLKLVSAIGMYSKMYQKARRAFLVGYDRNVPSLRQASHCIGCGQCVEHCPQKIDIPTELHRIDDYVEQLKQL